MHLIRPARVNRQEVYEPANLARSDHTDHARCQDAKCRDQTEIFACVRGTSSLVGCSDTSTETSLLVAADGLPMADAIWILALESSGAFAPCLTQSHWAGESGQKCVRCASAP